MHNKNHQNGREQKTVNHFKNECFKNGSTDLLNEIVGGDFTDHTLPEGYPEDVGGPVKFIKIPHQGFDGIKVDFQAQVAENDLVPTPKTLVGPHIPARSWVVPLPGEGDDGHF